MINAVVLARHGLTVSQAVRAMLLRTAREKKLPFDPFIPDAGTEEAMMEARKGGGKRFNNAMTRRAGLVS